MESKYKMRGRHQEASEAAAAKIGKDRLCALAESERGILHVCALQETAREQHERHETDAIDRGPEMQFDKRGVTPLAAHQPRHDVVHRAEHHHGKKCVETEMRISNARLAEVDVAGDGAQRNQNADRAKIRVRNRAEHSEAQCRTVAQEREISLHRYVMI